MNAIKTPSLDAIRIFLAVAETKSFTAAAIRLGVTPAASSKAVKLLETQHGVILFTRNTRRVALTEAGSALFSNLMAATGQIDDAFTALTAFRDRPAGNLRLTVPRALGALVLKALVPRFQREYPEVSLDISLDDGEVDLVEQGYDAGVRLGQSVAQGMVAVRLTGDLTWSVVGSPGYFSRAGRPKIPEDLVGHETLRYRFHNSRILPRWRFVRGGDTFHVETREQLVVNDTGLISEFARSGLGLAYLPDIEIMEYLHDGRLERVLEGFVPDSSGLFLYFAAKTQSQPKLRVFIDMAAENVERPTRFVAHA
jgi:DNA-binding transcriptional LysR family regulator